MVYCSLLISQVKPSFGVTAAEVLKFCVETNPRAYTTEGASSSSGSSAPDSGSGSGSGGSAEETITSGSAPAECYMLSAQITQSATTGAVTAEGATTSPLLTPKQRLALCANAPTAQGPIQCATSALSRGGKADTGRLIFGIRDRCCCATLFQRRIEAVRC